MFVAQNDFQHIRLERRDPALSQADRPDRCFPVGKFAEKGRQDGSPFPSVGEVWNRVQTVIAEVTRTGKEAKAWHRTF